MPGGSGHGHGGPASAAGLRVHALSKTFPGTRALDGVGLEVRRGAIHALIGGNGSGKSTLIKVLSGVESADPGGRVAIGEAEVAADRVTPAWSAAAGLRVVHQDLGLFGNLTVAENLFAGRLPPRRAGRIDWGAMRRHAQEVLDRVGVGVRASARLDALRAADQTLVAVARAMDDHSGPECLLLLDEPTARLPAREAEQLLSALTRLAGQGETIVFVSHRLDEVLSLCDAVTILRDGRVVATRGTVGLDEEQLAELMVGRAFQQGARPPRAGADEPVLRVRGLTAGRLRDVDLEVRAGEVVGVSGLVGSGRTRLLQSIFGARPRDGGSVEVAGKILPDGDVRAAVRDGVALIPEDRAGEGIFLNLGIPENVSASGTERYSSRGVLRHRRERRDAATAVSTFGIRTASVDAPLNSLSGGNQQKVVVARWLGMAPRVLLLDEPTQGVDVAARADIHAQIDAAVERGCAVVLVSSDVDEMERLADRVLTLSGGQLAAPVPTRHLEGANR